MAMNAKLVLLGALGLGACAGERPGAGGGDDSRITIEMIAKRSTNPVFLASRTGAEAAAR